MGLWEYGEVKTTLEIPDALMKRVKLRAVKRSQKLKDAITQLLELGMAATSEDEEPPKAPKPVRLRGGDLLTFRDIESAIDSGRE
jgi:hypothetical protein